MKKLFIRVPCENSNVIIAIDEIMIIQSFNSNESEQKSVITLKDKTQIFTYDTVDEIEETLNQK